MNCGTELDCSFQNVPKKSHSDAHNGEEKNYQAFQQGFQTIQPLNVQWEIPVPTKKEAQL
jgi:hypothetical protein